MMNQSALLFALPTFAAGLVALGLAVFVRRRLTHAEAAASYGFWATMAIWSVVAGLETLAPSLPAKVFLSKLMYFGIAPLPVFWLFFNLRYAAGKRVRLWSRWSLFFLVPLVTVILVWTNTAHRWMWTDWRLDESGALPLLVTERGWYFWWVHTAYSYSLLLAGTAVVVYALLTSSRNYSRQLIVLLMTSAAVVVINVLYLQDAGFLKYSDPTPVGFALGGVVLAWGMYRFRLLDMIPVAQRVVFESLPDCVVILDPEDRIVDLNPAAARGFTLDRRRSFGQPASRVLPVWPEVERGLAAGAREAIESSIDRQGVRCYFKTRSAPLTNARGETVGRVVMAQDVTESREYRELAIRDPLTGLANRRHFDGEAQKMLDLAERMGWTAALLFIDINDFKRVNDEYGHQAGDALLVEVAQRLGGPLRSYETLARVGGDEFAVLLQRANRQDASEVCHRIAQHFREPLLWRDREVEIRASIGVAMYPEAGDTLEQLLEHADAAMYGAKATRGGFGFERRQAGDGVSRRRSAPALRPNQKP